MRHRYGRSTANLAATALVLVTMMAGVAHAGTVTVEYSGSLVSHEPATGYISAISGAWTVTVNAMRATPSASYGFISGATISLLSLMGGPTHDLSGPTAWTIGAGGALGAPGVPPQVLSNVFGTFSGLNTAGTAFTAPSTYPGFYFLPYYVGSRSLNGNAGNYNLASGPGSFLGFLAVAAYGAPSGGGTGAACFDAKTPYGYLVGTGPCFTAMTAVVSQPGIGSVPGFAVVGAEIARTVAIPEPRVGLMLTLGAMAVAALSRWRHR